MNIKLVILVITIMLAGCEQELKKGDTFVIYRQAYLARIADATGVEGKKQRLEYGTPCAVVPKGILTYLEFRSSGVSDLFFRYDAKGNEGESYSVVNIINTGIRYQNLVWSAHILEEECPSGTVIQVGYYNFNEVYKWDAYQRKVVALGK